MAKKINEISKSEYQALEFSRWVLFLVTACEATGIENVSRDRLHTLLFISFSSSRFYDLKPLRQRAQRTVQGPYYRAAHIALGKLVLAGLVHVKEFKPHFSEKDLQFDGIFSLTASGLQIANKLKETETGAKIYRFLLDLCLGVTSAMQNGASTSHSLENTLHKDLAYQQAIARPGVDLIMEESPDEINPTLRGLQSIDTFLRSQYFINNKDVLSAYQRLLAKRAA